MYTVARVLARTHRPGVEDRKHKTAEEYQPGGGQLQLLSGHGQSRGSGKQRQMMCIDCEMEEAVNTQIDMHNYRYGDSFIFF